MGFRLGARLSSHSPPPAGCCPPGCPSQFLQAGPCGAPPFSGGDICPLHRLRAPSLPFRPPLPSCPPTSPLPADWHQPGGSQQPHEWGQSRDGGFLAQESSHPWGNWKVFLLPIIPELLLMFFLVFIPVPVDTAPTYFPGWGTCWDKDPLGTGTPSGPHPSRTQQHPEHKRPGAAYRDTSRWGRAPQLTWAVRDRPSRGDVWHSPCPPRCCRLPAVPHSWPAGCLALLGCSSSRVSSLPGAGRCPLCSVGHSSSISQGQGSA